MEHLTPECSALDIATNQFRRRPTAFPGSLLVRDRTVPDLPQFHAASTSDGY
jgi:hypothetical protein